MACNKIEHSPTNVSIEFTNVEDKAYNLVYNPVIYLNTKKTFSRAILYKLLIPQIFRDKDKILLLDIDTIVRKLKEMYSQDFDDNYLIAHKESIPTLYSKIWYQNEFLDAKYFYINIFRLPQYMFSDKKYFINTRVMLFNRINKYIS